MVATTTLPIHDAAHVYDEYAQQYDRLLEENRINAYMRRAMSQALLSTFLSGNRLIEIGCGTGDEALALATNRCELFAFDPSPRMIEIARRKAVEHRMGRNVRFFVGRASDLSRELAKAAPGMQFDGAYASFSLSYERDLQLVSKALAPWVRPSGHFVIATMNRFCGTEFAAAILTGHPRLAGRRLNKQTLHKVGQYSTPVYPRTTREVVNSVSDYFVFEDVRALPAILPPHYANRALARWPLILDILSELDPPLGMLPLLRCLGDHNLLRFRRKA